MRRTGTRALNVDMDALIELSRDRVAVKAGRRTPDGRSEQKETGDVYSPAWRAYEIPRHVVHSAIDLPDRSPAISEDRRRAAGRSQTDRPLARAVLTAMFK